MSFTTLSDGRSFPLLRPTAADIPGIQVLADALAKINRFSGGAATTWSVAEHSLLVADLLPRRLRLYGLLHDAHEAIVGDITTPVKAALELLASRPGLVQRLVAPIDDAIHLAFGLPWPLPLADRALVDRADARALATEWRDLRPGCAAPPGMAEPAPVPMLKPDASWPRVAERFVARYHRLRDAGLDGDTLDATG
ncbi:hypothetical protein [Azospirillum sp. B4]|uniref:hypothetical protein n=1 Tax=Azospirillum sp. B4 TaxID=95605 RepID=UPI000348963D|nr:hypothetical protein [Azospirillum sp. B4]